MVSMEHQALILKKDLLSRVKKKVLNKLSGSIHLNGNEREFIENSLEMNIQVITDILNTEK